MLTNAWPVGGRTARLISEVDWSRTSLGPVSAWKQSLRTSVDIVLNSPVAMVLMWGHDHVMIYNDAYSLIAGARHPECFGNTVPAMWPEIWDWNRAILEAGFRGEVQTYEEQHMVVLRNGVPEDVWFDLFYTPVRNEDGTVGGVLCTVIEVTQRVKNNRQLLNETEFLRRLFEQAPSFMAVLRGPDHIFDLANSPYLKLVGHRDIIGLPLRDALPEIREQGFIDLLDEVYRTGVPYVGKQTKVLLHMNSSDTLEERLLEFVYQPIRDACDKVAGIFVEGIDVTDRMETEERLRIAQEAAGIGAFEWFPDSDTIVFSEMYRKIWGIPPSVTIKPETLVSLLDAEDRPLAATAKLNEENPLAYSEYRITRPDTGEKRWIARQGQVMRRHERAPRRYVGVAFDITDRKRTEEALRASERRLAAFFGQAAVGLSELDLDGRFLRVNDALCQMLGYRRSELEGLEFTTITHHEDGEPSRALLQQAIHTGTSFTIEKRCRRADGLYIWTSSNVNCIVDEHGQRLAVTVVTVDITERRRAEEALREINETLEQRVRQEVQQRIAAEDALRQSQKMEAVGQLTGGIAHDFNNVLQVIRGNLELLQSFGGTGRMAAQRLQAAIEAVDRGSRLSSHLLAFARRQPLRPVVTDLRSMMTSLEALMTGALGAEISVRVEAPEDLWNILVDRTQLENVILNLAINARDAMRGRGQLSIALDNVVMSDGEAGRQADVEPGEYVRLSISDTGCGMSDEVKARAFDPFFTTKAEGEGTGLGLSMAYGFVRQSGGYIRIESAPGQGTTIRVHLPRTGQPLNEMAAPVRAEITGGHETVLVVEDDGSVRMAVVDTLVALGYRVLEAGDAENALAVLKAGAAVDLLFTDVLMPGAMRSTELALQARLMRPDLRILFTSGYTRDVIMHGGRLDSGVELISKPYKQEELARKVRQVLEDRAPSVLSPEGGTEAAGARASDSQAGGLRILVVEDNEDGRYLVTEMLEALGHTVLPTASAEEALTHLAASRFDVLFTDIQLPGMSGRELAREAVRRGHGFSTLFVSGLPMLPEELAEGDWHFLRKPYELGELNAVLMRISERAAA